MATTTSFSPTLEERNHWSKCSTDVISIARPVSSGLTLKLARHAFSSAERGRSSLRRHRDGRAHHDGAKGHGEFLSILGNPGHFSLACGGAAGDMPRRVGPGLMIE